MLQTHIDIEMEYLRALWNSLKKKGRKIKTPTQVHSLYPPPWKDRAVNFGNHRCTLTARPPRRVNAFDICFRKCHGLLTGFSPYNLPVPYAPPPLLLLDKPTVDRIPPPPLLSSPQIRFRPPSSLLPFLVNISLFLKRSSSTRLSAPTLGLFHTRKCHTFSLITFSSRVRFLFMIYWIISQRSRFGAMNNASLPAPAPFNI